MGGGENGVVFRGMRKLSRSALSYSTVRPTRTTGTGQRLNVRTDTLKYRAASSLRSQRVRSSAAISSVRFINADRKSDSVPPGVTLSECHQRAQDSLALAQMPKRSGKIRRRPKRSSAEMPTVTNGGCSSGSDPAKEQQKSDNIGSMAGAEARKRIREFLRSLECDPETKAERGLSPSRRRKAERAKRRVALAAHIASHPLPPPPLNPHQYRYVADYPQDRDHLDWRDPEAYNYTRLHKAAATNDAREAERLLRCGAHPFVRDNNGRSPLGTAYDEGHFEIAAILRRAMDRIREHWERYHQVHGRWRIRSQSKRYASGT